MKINDADQIQDIDLSNEYYSEEEPAYTDYELEDDKEEDRAGFSGSHSDSEFRFTR